MSKTRDRRAVIAGLLASLPVLMEPTCTPTPPIASNPLGRGGVNKTSAKERRARQRRAARKEARR